MTEPIAEETVEDRRGPVSANFSEWVVRSMIGQNVSTNIADGTGKQYLALHSSDPGTTGAGLIAGIPAQPIVWGTPNGGGPVAAGSVTGQPLTFNVPAGTYSHYAVYNSANPSAASYLYSKALSGTITVPANVTGIITVTPGLSWEAWG